MEDAEEQYEEYSNQYKKIQDKLSDPEIAKKVEKLFNKIAKLVDCDAKHLELNYFASPHVDDYEEVQDSNEFEIPDAPTMKLGTLIEHLQEEEDMNMDVYFDPIYLKAGVNEIVNLLTTTLDNKMIVVPIGNYKKK